MALLKINRKISLDLAYFPKKEGQLQALFNGGRNQLNLMPNIYVNCRAVKLTSQ